MLTGQLPFEASDATELAKMHRSQIPTPPRRINPLIPETLEEIILKVLSKEPAARYRTADQLGRVLLSFGSINKEKTGPIVLPQVNKSNNAHSQVSRQINEPITEPEIIDFEDSNEVEVEQPVDWVTWLLGLLAFTAVFGLIPFWLYIYFSINP
jgi:serine/threonine-protein kinase